MTMMDILLEQLGGNAGAQVAQQLGVDEATASQAIRVALPMLVTALSRNADDPEGATALHDALARDHSGSVLDDLVGYVAQGGDIKDGTAILGHVLGGRRAQKATVDEVSQHTGVDPSLLSQLLPLLAPIVLAYLGRQQRQQGFDPGALTGYLNEQETQIQNIPLPRAETRKPSGGLTDVLDQDGDGSLAGEATKVGMSILERLLRGNRGS